MAFGLGVNDKGISTVDTSGVALAAIQGLKAETDAKMMALQREKDSQWRRLTEDIAQRDTQIAENLAQVAALQTELAQLRETVQRLFAQESLASAD